MAIFVGYYHLTFVVRCAVIIWRVLILTDRSNPSDSSPIRGSKAALVVEHQMLESFVYLGSFGLLR
jgi:hypothetical protein